MFLDGWNHTHRHTISQFESSSLVFIFSPRQRFKLKHFFLNLLIISASVCIKVEPKHVHSLITVETTPISTYKHCGCRRKASGESNNFPLCLQRLKCCFLLSHNSISVKLNTEQVSGCDECALTLLS